MDRQSRWRRRNPWARYVEWARRRCRDPRHRDYQWYGERGIECRLTARDLKAVWFRDRAWTLDKPSLDRIDPDGHYEISNVRFIEFWANSRAPHEPGPPAPRPSEPIPEDLMDLGFI